MWAHWTSGQIRIGEEQIPFPDWLAGIRMLFRALGRQSGRRRLSHAVVQIANPVPLPQSALGPLEISRLADRTAWLPLILWSVDHWPDRLMDICMNANLRLGDLIDPSREHAPNWMRAVISKLPYQTRPRQNARKRQSSLKTSVAAARLQIDLPAAITERLNALHIHIEP